MSDINLIKEKIDVVDLIGEYVQLKPAGVNHKGLCPFHHEKSPSFNVNSDKGFYHCFGCGESGDLISFVQKIKGLSFIDSVKEIASDFGIKIEIKEQTQADKIKTDSIQKIHDLIKYLPSKYRN
jgi:DNA primase